MLKYRHYTVLKASCITVLAVIYDSFLERIVHNAVKLTAYEITSADTVALLVGRILPDLADKHPIGLFLKEYAADIRDERLLQLVGHIEAPAACAGARPAADDPVFTKEEVANGEGILVQRRHVADAPPARIGPVLVEMVCVFPARPARHPARDSCHSG